MEQRFRRGFTAVEKKELWDRWQRGESFKGIGRAFARPLGRRSPVRVQEQERQAKKLPSELYKSLNLGPG